MAGAALSAAAGAALARRVLQRVPERPKWGLHFGTIGHWMNTAPAAREGHGTAAFPWGEQADTLLRRWLELHDIERVLADDEQAAFVAYTVIEAVTNLAAHALRQTLAIVPHEYAVPVHRAVMASLVGASQRVTWHAAAHLGQDIREPYGPSVPGPLLPDADNVRERP